MQLSVNLKQIVVAFMIYGWLTFPNFTTFWQSRRFRFSNSTQIFSKESWRILYLNSAKDDVMPLMCKFESNRCGFRVAENWSLRTLSFWQQCNDFCSSNSTQIFSKESYTWIQQKIILCSSCVNLKQIGVVFVMLKIDLSELCHPDSVCKSLSFF